MAVKGKSLYPVDSRYSWLVAILGSFIYSLALGQVRCCGIIVIELKDIYEIPESQSVWMVGLSTTLILGAGPVSGSLIALINHRNVLLIGSLLVSTSLMMLAFVPDYRVFYLAFSLMGVGFNFSFVPALVTTSHYFVKRRALAMGITAGGAGLGSFYYPPLVRYLLDSLTFSEAMVCLAGIYIHMAVAAMFMRPESSWSHLATSTVTNLDSTERSVEQYNVDMTNPNSKERSSCDDGQPISITDSNHLSPLVMPCNSTTAAPHTSHAPSPPGSAYGSQALSGAAEVMLASDMNLHKLGDGNKEGADDISDEARLTFIESAKLLFASRVYLVYMLSCLIVTMGYNIIFTAAIPFFAEEINVAKTHVAYSIALSGILGIFSRVGHNYLAGQKYVTALLQSGASVVLAGCSLLFIILDPNVHSFYLTCAGLGLFTTVIVSLVPVILLERFGPHTVSIGMGFIYGAQGIGATISFASAPIIQEQTGTWLACLWWAFGVIVLSGVINLVTGILNPIPEQKYLKCFQQKASASDNAPA